jgi:hypothetical protein
MPRRQRFKPSRKPKPAIEPSEVEVIPNDLQPPREEARSLPAEDEQRG